MSIPLRHALLGAACLVVTPALAQMESVIVTGRSNTPANTEGASAQNVSATVNVANTEDTLKYLPDVLVRKRHIGDTQAPVTTRTSGLGASARSLVYADGVLLSALIGNNNSFASPRWGMVAPEDVARVDVLYGPFSAQYPGNSIGSVIEITTRMPDSFQINGKIQTAVQDFSQYGTIGTYASYQTSAGIADRHGSFAFRLSANYLNSRSQPLAYMTLTRPAAASGAGTSVTGAFADVNRTNAPIEVIGAGGFEYQRQENVTLKLAYDFAPDILAAYTLGLFHQDDDGDIQSYLKDAAGNPVYSGIVNIRGYNYNIAASSFSNNLYNLRQTHVMHAGSLNADMGAWNWSVVGSLYDFAGDIQRVPTVAIPAARTGGAGTITKMNGTGWTTLDAKVGWDGGAHKMSLGFHRDDFALSNNKFSTGNWISGATGALATAARGKSAANAVWLQDAWTLADTVTATIGGRFENWRAYNGFNYSAAPALSVNQLKLSGNFFSPKASLSWQVAEDWNMSGSFGIATRMPTVSELYQAVTTGATLSVPNPNLKPERAASFDLSITHDLLGGKIRASYFHEDLGNALISQSAPLVSGSTSLFNYVQNITRIRTNGAELVWNKTDAFFSGFDISGSVTYVDSRIVKDPVLPAAQGRQTPGIPNWRATAVATWRPSDAFSVSMAARYSDRVYATIDNSDTVTHTYQGFDPFLVFDVRTQYTVDENWSLAAGIDNVGNRKYFLFHPFPQRTFFMELKYAQ